MSNKKINSEVVANFERNGKMYLILELDANESKTNLDRESVADFDLPDWSDFDFNVWLEGTRVFMSVTYKGNELWKGSFDIVPSGCINENEIILGSLFGATIYLRWTELCYYSERTTLHLKSQLWAKYEVSIPIVGEQEIKTKLGEIDRDFKI
ncbi:hypothetical protein P9H08_14490 [Bacillus cereus]|nr:hypothetical protein [Bacillus cereus]MED3312905.1 hypothetical protein [Bacillus thuringiensis]